MSEALDIKICMGSSCYLRGNKKSVEVVQRFLEARGSDPAVSFSGHLCQGFCKDGPNMTINGRMHHAVDPVVILDLLNQLLPNPTPWTT